MLEPVSLDSTTSSDIHYPCDLDWMPTLSLPEYPHLMNPEFLIQSGINNKVSSYYLNYWQSLVISILFHFIFNKTDSKTRRSLKDTQETGLLAQVRKGPPIMRWDGSCRGVGAGDLLSCAIWGGALMSGFFGGRGRDTMKLVVEKPQTGFSYCFRMPRWRSEAAWCSQCRK